MCRLCESGSLLSYCVDAKRANDNRLIFQASGVLAAVNILNVKINWLAENKDTPRRELEMLEDLSDELKDLAYEMRQHHEALLESTSGE